jgi:hypothetical protein
MHLQTEASPHLLNHCRCLLPPSRQTFPPCSPTSVPPTLFSPPPAQSRSKMKASGALVRPLTGESLEPPKYVSCSRTVEFQAQTQEVISYKKGSRHSTRTYPADGGRQPLVRTFLGRGPDSSREDEDTVATAAIISRTYWASWRGVEPISLSPMPTKGSSTHHGHESLAWEKVVRTG